MSAPLSNHRLRNKVHTELAALLDGGQLAVSPRAVRDYLADQRLIAQVAQQYRAQQPDAPTGGRAAIITAGVPGAGKSSALGATATGYRRIDPDEIKDILLARLDVAGLLDARLDHVLSDGNSVSLGELAGWVHRASTDAADRVRTASLQIGENFVMEGTLSWHKLPVSYVDELALGGYERLTVLDIEVPLAVAIEQSKCRWWEGRHSGLLTHGMQIGAALSRNRRSPSCTRDRAQLQHAPLTRETSILAPTMPVSNRRFSSSAGLPPAQNTKLDSHLMATSSPGRVLHSAPCASTAEQCSRTGRQSSKASDPPAPTGRRAADAKQLPRASPPAGTRRLRP